MDIFLLITLVILAVAMMVSAIRMVIGPTIWDRLLSLNLVSAKIIMMVAVYAVYAKNIFLLDIAISYGIIGFLAMTLLSKFIMIGGREK